MKTYHIRYIDKFWQLTEVGSNESEQKWKTKSEAIKACREALKAVATEDEPISLRVCNKNGQFMKNGEFTYPRSADPERSKG